MIDSRSILRFQSSGGARPDRALLLALVAGLAVLVLVWTDAVPLLRGPAPYPPEWRWELRAGATSGRVLPALLCGTGLLVLLSFPGGGASRGRARAALAASVVLGLGLQLGLLALEPDGALRTLVQRTQSRTVTSYYSAALSPLAADPRAFLAGHDRLLDEMQHGAKHASTHPPGPVLFYRGLLGLFDARPGLAQALLDAAGLGDPDRRPAARAAALAGPLLLMFACAATAWPIAALARRAGAGDAAAAGAGVLWALLPGPALMAPQFDQALALPVAGCAAALAAAVAAERGRVPLALLAGLLAGIALFLSYGAVAFLALSGGAALAAAGALPALRRRLPAVLAWAAVGAAVPFAVTMALGHHPLRSALAALAIHRQVYTAPRSYALWLLFNPVDLAVFLGVPLAVLFLAHALRAARLPLAGAAPLDRFTLVAAAALVLLLLSGSVRGEAGRIWIPLMPALLVAAAARPGPRWAAPVLGALLLALDLALRLRWEVG